MNAAVETMRVLFDQYMASGSREDAVRIASWVPHLLDGIEARDALLKECADMMEAYIGRTNGLARTLKAMSYGR